MKEDFICEDQTSEFCFRFGDLFSWKLDQKLKRCLEVNHECCNSKSWRATIFNVIFIVAKNTSGFSSILALQTSFLSIMFDYLGQELLLQNYTFQNLPMSIKNLKKKEKQSVYNQLLCKIKNRLKTELVFILKLESSFLNMLHQNNKKLIFVQKSMFTN